MILIFFKLFILTFIICNVSSDDNVNYAALYDKKVIKGNRNALFLVQNGFRRQFPDFYTFDTMNFTVPNILKVKDEHMNTIPLGKMIDKIKAPPAFRPDDYFYHEYCNSPDRMVNDVGVLPNLGNFFRSVNTLKRIRETKKIDILALGGSITAGGYFEEFARLLREKTNSEVVVRNHGHGATEITYIDRYQPDIVLIDFSVNDYGHPKLMEALIRKTLNMPSLPIVLLVNFWVYNQCPTTRYMLHGLYYQLPIINMCPAINLCYSKQRLPRYIVEEYSKTDGVHPWGTKGVSFIGGILMAWYNRYQELITDEILTSSMSTVEEAISRIKEYDSEEKESEEIAIGGHFELPPPIYKLNPLGVCTRCDALVEDADSILTPVDPPKGFRVVTRMKVGYGGFNPSDKNSSTKSFKRSWQAEDPGSTISFQFYGSSVRVALWQRRDSMGVLHATVDGNTNNIAKATGFFQGFTWAMEKNNTGRSEIITLFEGLEDTNHTLKLTVSDTPANPWVVGHTCQIFAILSSSEDVNCKSALSKESNSSLLIKKKSNHQHRRQKNKHNKQHNN